MYWQNTKQVKTMEHSHTLDPQALTYRQQMHQWYFQIAVRTRNKKTSLSNLIKSNRKGNHLKWQVNIMQEITLGTAMLHAVDAAYLLTSFHSIDSVSIIDCILICHLCELLMARRWPERTVQNNRTFLCLSSVSILFSRSWNSSLQISIPRWNFFVLPLRFCSLRIITLVILKKGSTKRHRCKDKPKSEAKFHKPKKCYNQKFKMMCEWEQT